MAARAAEPQPSNHPQRHPQVGCIHTVELLQAADSEFNLIRNRGNKGVDADHGEVISTVPAETPANQERESPAQILVRSICIS